MCALHHTNAQGCYGMAESARTPTTRRAMSRCRGRRHTPLVYVDVLHVMCMCVYSTSTHSQWVVLACIQAEAWGDEAATHHLYRKATENSTLRFSHSVQCSDKQLEMLLRKDSPMPTHTHRPCHHLQSHVVHVSLILHHELCVCVAFALLEILIRMLLWHLGLLRFVLFCYRFGFGTLKVAFDG